MLSEIARVGIHQSKGKKGPRFSTKMLSSIFIAKRFRKIFPLVRKVCKALAGSLKVNIERLKLQEEEVQAVKWATKEEILELLSQVKFIPYYKELIEFLFAIRNNYGIIKKEN